MRTLADRYCLRLKPSACLDEAKANTRLRAGFGGRAGPETHGRAGESDADRSRQAHVTQEEVCLRRSLIKTSPASREGVYSPGPLLSSGRPCPSGPCLFWPSSRRHPRWPPACTPLSLSGSRTNRRRSQLPREHMWQRGSGLPPLRSTPPNTRFHFRHSQHCSARQDPAGGFKSPQTAQEPRAAKLSAKLVTGSWWEVKTLAPSSKNAPKRSRTM